MKTRVILILLISLCSPLDAQTENDNPKPPPVDPDSTFYGYTPGTTPSSYRRVDPSPAISDQTKLARFAELLAAHGVLKLPEDPSPVPATLPAEEDEILPQILFTEHLSSGQVLTVWKGRPDRLHVVQTSRDGIHWRDYGATCPNIQGIGFSSDPYDINKPNYRVLEGERVVIPNDPSGGDGKTKMGATIEVIMDNGKPTHVEVRGHFPGRPPYSAEFYLDGEKFEEAQVTSDSEPVYRLRLPIEQFSPGNHILHAVMPDIVDVLTPTPDDPSSGCFEFYRTPNLFLTLPNR